MAPTLRSKASATSTKRSKTLAAPPPASVVRKPESRYKQANKKSLSIHVDDPRIRPCSVHLVRISDKPLGIAQISRDSTKSADNTIAEVSDNHSKVINCSVSLVRISDKTLDITPISPDSTKSDNNTVSAAPMVVSDQQKAFNSLFNITAKPRSLRSNSCLLPPAHNKSAVPPPAVATKATDNIKPPVKSVPIYKTKPVATPSEDSMFGTTAKAKPRSLRSNSSLFQPAHNKSVTSKATNNMKPPIDTSKPVATPSEDSMLDTTAKPKLRSLRSKSCFLPPANKKCDVPPPVVSTKATDHMKPSVPIYKSIPVANPSEDSMFEQEPNVYDYFSNSQESETNVDEDRQIINKLIQQNRIHVVKKKQVGVRKKPATKRLQPAAARAKKVETMALKGLKQDLLQALKDKEQDRRVSPVEPVVSKPVVPVVAGDRGTTDSFAFVEDPPSRSMIPKTMSYNRSRSRLDSPMIYARPPTMMTTLNHRSKSRLGFESAALTGDTEPAVSVVAGDRGTTGDLDIVNDSMNLSVIPKETRNNQSKSSLDNPMAVDRPATKMNPRLSLLKPTHHSTPIRVPAPSTRMPTIALKSPWRVPDENVTGRCYYRSTIFDDISSLSSPIPVPGSSKVAPSKSLAIENEKVTTSTPVITNASKRVSFSSRSLNVSDMENIAPVLSRSKELARERPMTILGERNMNPLRSPLKPLAIRNVLLSPQKTYHPKHSSPMHSFVAQSPGKSVLYSSSGSSNDSQRQPDSVVEPKTPPAPKTNDYFGFDVGSASDDDTVSTTTARNDHILDRTYLKRLLPGTSSAATSTEPLRKHPTLFKNPEPPKQANIKDVINAAAQRVSNDSFDFVRHGGDQSSEDACPELFVTLWPEKDNPNRRSYARVPKRKRYVESSDDEDDDEDVPSRKKRTKNEKRKEKVAHALSKELDEFADVFNSMCESVDQYELVVEKSA